MIAVCVIPARYGSTRFPGKPLAKIQGKPMIQWVYQQAKTATRFQKVLVATDDPRIEQAVKDFGGEVCLTPSELPSGTDRVARAVQQLEADVVVNLQGDEPLVEPALLDQLVEVFEKRPEVLVATPIKKIFKIEDLLNPNLVRVVKDKQNFALYFTRSVIPYLRDVPRQRDWLQYFSFYKHVGIYAYRKKFLLQLTQLPQTELEKAEKLEQLRILEHGFKIYTIETEYDSISVDTPGELEQLNQKLKNQTKGRS
ncbi:MAG: 3-deoxy-manno-octulosonate cytidylyltransferase [Caldisericaceae bacterium]|nr:3-deoxy-manno-octulosonate cytidylyltransferase [Caldisericaceae bacterium]